jgi:hypothetical protein
MQEAVSFDSGVPMHAEELDLVGGMNLKKKVSLANYLKGRERAATLNYYMHFSYHRKKSKSAQRNTQCRLPPNFSFGHDGKKFQNEPSKQ